MVKKIKIQLITILSIIFLWEIIAYFNIFDQRVLPRFSEIIKELINNSINGMLLNQLLFSIIIIFKGIIISFLIAMILIFLGKKSEIFSIIIDTFSSVFHPLPGIAILPFVILWTGVNELGILIIIIHSVLWSLLITFKAGVKSVPETLIYVSINLKMNIFQKFIHLYFPNAIPNIISGLKIGWGRGWRALISAEMIFGAIGGNGGIGWYIFQKRVFMDTKGMFSGLLMIVIIGIIVEDFIFYFFEKVTIKKWGIENDN